MGLIDQIKAIPIPTALEKVIEKTHLKGYFYKNNSKENKVDSLKVTRDGVTKESKKNQPTRKTATQETKSKSTGNGSGEEKTATATQKTDFTNIKNKFIYTPINVIGKREEDKKLEIEKINETEVKKYSQTIPAFYKSYYDLSQLSSFIEVHVIFPGVGDQEIVIDNLIQIPYNNIISFEYNVAKSEGGAGGSSLSAILKINDINNSLISPILFFSREFGIDSIKVKISFGWNDFYSPRYFKKQKKPIRINSQMFSITNFNVALSDNREEWTFTLIADLVGGSSREQLIKPHSINGNKLLLPYFMYKTMRDSEITPGENDEFIQQKFDKYSETLKTLKDKEKFKNFWNKIKPILSPVALPDRKEDIETFSDVIKEVND